MKKGKQKGITLVALVVMIIVLLILAGISIQALTNQGLFVQVNRAQKETQRAQVTEWLNLKLMEEKMYNPTGTAEEIIEATRATSYGNMELKKMGKSVVVDENTSTQEDGEQVDVYFYVQVDEDVYKVEMEGAKFIGEAGKFPPVIKLESITSTTNSIIVKVTTKRNSGGKIEFYIKKEGDSDYTLSDTKTETDVNYTYTGLEQNKKYSIKVVAIAANGQVKECIKEITTAKQLVNEIKITQESATVQIGETLDLAVTISPEDAYNKSITWSSSNPEVVTIEQNGKVTAIAEGTTTITAIAQDGSDSQGNCIIKVENNILYLYNEGDECTNVTGGWENASLNSWDYSYWSSPYTADVTYGTTSRTLNKEAKYLSTQLSYTASGITYLISGTYSTKNMIDFTKYSKVYIDFDYIFDWYDDNHHYNVALDFCKTKFFRSFSGECYKNINTESTNESKIYEIDISDISGAYYLQNYIFLYGEKSNKINYKLKRIWLE